MSGGVVQDERWRGGECGVRPGIGADAVERFVSMCFFESGGHVQKANKATKCPSRRSARIVGATTRLRAAQHNHEADTGLGCRMGRVLARALQRVGVLLAGHRPQLRSHWPVQHAWATDRCGRPRAAHLCQRIGGLDICRAHETRLHRNPALSFALGSALEAAAKNRGAPRETSSSSPGCATRGAIGIDQLQGIIGHGADHIPAWRYRTALDSTRLARRGPHL